MSFSILSGHDTGHTLVPDVFLEQYMPSADGSFVKLYLYLLMLYQQRRNDNQLSVSFLADRMECTEKDILRALRYWQREGLLEIKESQGEIENILLCEIISSHGPETPPKGIVTSREIVSQENNPDTAKASASDDVIHTRWETDGVVRNLPPAAARSFDAPTKQTYTPMQAEALRKDSEIDGAIDAIEQLLGEPVSPAHLQTILYFMCDVGFSSELLVTLYRVATKKGKRKPNYIEAIGISWASQGITTPQEAENEAANFSGRYALVSKAFGIQGNLKPAQMEIIDSWEMYHFADNIIAEACKRTVLQTGDANFQYASKILENWHSKQVISLQDIEKCDESYKNKKKSTGNSGKPSAKRNHFQNFPQRSYSANDYSSLEKQLLQSQKN